MLKQILIAVAGIGLLSTLATLAGRASAPGGGRASGLASSEPGPPERILAPSAGHKTVWRQCRIFAPPVRTAQT